MKPRARASTPVTIERSENEVSPSTVEAAGSELASAILHAMSASLAERSLDDLSVEDVLTAANASRASFYFYFSSKDDAFLALFRGAAEGIASRFELLGHVNRADAAAVERVITEWLNYDIDALAVSRTAIHGWLRRPELRDFYLSTMARMTDALEAVIEADRATGIAVEGPPAPQLAAVLMWTMERSFAGAMAGQEHIEDFNQLIGFLADLLNAVVYGR